MRLLLLKFLPGLLLACSPRPAANPAADGGINAQTVHPFTGCWQSEDGLAREVWTADPSGWLFGYALNRKEDGSIGFFEQTRLEISGDKMTLVVIGGKGDIVRFEREITGNAAEHKFINAEHDYPQIITYRPGPGRLDAVISTLDGGGAIAFNKQACDQN